MKHRSITTPPHHTQTEQILHQSCPSQACRQCDTQGILPAHAWASDPCPSLLAQGQPPPQSSSTLLPHSDAWFPAPFVYSPDMPQQAKLMSRPSKPESPQHPQCADNPLSPGAWGPHTRYVLSRAVGVQRVSPDQCSPSPEPSLPSVVVVVTFPSHPQTGPEPRKAGGGDGERGEEEALAMPEIPLLSQGGTNVIPSSTESPMSSVAAWPRGEHLSSAVQTLGLSPISTTFWL